MNTQFKTFHFNLFTIATTVVLVVFCFISYSLSLKVQSNYEAKSELIYEGNRFMNESSYLTDEVRAYTTTGNVVHSDNYFREKSKSREVSVEKMEELELTAFEKDIIVQISIISSDLESIEMVAIENAKNGNFDSAVAHVFGENYNSAVEKIKALEVNLLKSIDIHTSNEVDNIKILSNLLQIALGICAILIIILQVINHFKNNAIISEFERLATVDVFSGLCNRNKYVQFLDKIIVDKTDNIGIMYLDINGIKNVNDKYGHEYGDKVILRVVDIMKTCFVENIFRIGGDEFVALVLDDDRNSYEEKVLNLRNMMDSETELSVSIGSAWCSDTSNLLKQIAYADELMFVDKQNYYTNSQLNLQSYRATVASELISSIEKNEFTILLQPKVRLSDRKVVGGEALVRKKGENGKLISPESFIQIFEADGVISILDFYVFELVCKMLKKWRELGETLIHISVNFSRITIIEYKVAQKINGICQKYGIEPELIMIEMTEQISNISVESLNEILQEIKSFGFRISLDDFGREYANLAVLSKIEFDEIKLDKSLIDDLASNPATSTATRCIVELCNAYRPTSIVVEGIETEEQIVKLQELSCNLSAVQGYYFSKPLTKVDFYNSYIHLTV